MHRQNHGNDRYGAQHQHQEENFDDHRDLGYQNEPAVPNGFLGPPTDETSNVGVRQWLSLG